MSDSSHPDHDRYAREVKLFEEEYGDDWEGTMIEYDRDFVSLPGYGQGSAPRRFTDCRSMAPQRQRKI